MVYQRTLKKEESNKENLECYQKVELHQDDFFVKLHKGGRFPSSRKVKRVEKLVTYREKLYFVVSCKEDKKSAFIVLRENANKCFPDKVIKFYEQLITFN